MRSVKKETCCNLSLWLLENKGKVVTLRKIPFTLESLVFVWIFQDTNIREHGTIFIHFKFNPRMIYVSRFFFLSLSVSPVKRIIKLDSLCVDYLLFPFTKIRIRVCTINSHSLLSKSLLELDFDLSNNTTIQLNLIPPI